jgi:type II secretion system (T2SS) protein E
MRIGEMLARFIPLTDQDIEEVLHEQSCTHQPFGQVAISLGLCQPPDVWRAWSSQLDLHPHEVDIEALGVDAQATTLLPVDLAQAHTVLPLRICGSELILATVVGDVHGEDDPVAIHISHLGLKVKYVTAPREQVLRAIAEYYPSKASAA